ncbi:hypothetical protein SAMN05216353_11462 [Halobacillus alkaliphilus]|uniref:Uncharacterized protein n=1 Tax=Halobacillus alkaliphilus TaxID=396056 RepID=A0A1I2MP11_9BACI|nr:hypothetical protein [Halobacillus alkaliphilus]SFF93173.1 hypothetical protein SAMN05216353_11462 [Halobacillus alkaliphilus]
MLYRMSIYILGMFVNFFGVALLIKATLGAGFWTALFVGLSDRLGFTVGIWYAIFQLIFIFVNGWLMKQKPEVRALLPLVLESLILDFWVEIVFKNMTMASAPFLVQLAVLLIGVTFSALGVSIYILPQLPRAPVDQLFLVVAKRFNVSLRLSQTAIALTTSTAAFFVGGPVGLGTAAGVAFAGILIQYFYTYGYPLYYLYHPHYRERFTPVL